MIHYYPFLTNINGEKVTDDEKSAEKDYFPEPLLKYNQNKETDQFCNKYINNIINESKEV